MSAEVLARLETLWRKLEYEGLYVRANTVSLAIERIRELHIMTDPRTPSAVRFSPEERALIHKAAEEAGLPFTSYVRMAALAAAKAAQKATQADRAKARMG